MALLFISEKENGLLITKKIEIFKVEVVLLLAAIEPLLDVCTLEDVEMWLPGHPKFDTPILSGDVDRFLDEVWPEVYVPTSPQWFLVLHRQ